jgi:hypothetical protein
VDIQERQTIMNKPGRPRIYKKRMMHRISLRVPDYYKIALPPDIAVRIRDWIKRTYIDKEILKERVDHA